MSREILKRIRLYFCPMCGTLVSCTRKMRRHPNRVCQAGKCIDYVNCRIRSIYTIGKVKSLLIHQETKRRFYKKYSLHYVLCGDCRE